MIVVPTSIAILLSAPALNVGAILAAKVQACRQCAQESTDSIFVRCYEEENYECRPGAIIEAHRALGGGPFPTRLADIIEFSRQYNHLNFVNN